MWQNPLHVVALLPEAGALAGVLPGVPSPPQFINPFCATASNLLECQSGRQSP